MGEETIIELSNGLKATLTPISLDLLDELERFFEDRGIPKESIPAYLVAFGRDNGVSPKRGSFKR